jgi:hypothetical protein
VLAVVVARVAAPSHAGRFRYSAALPVASSDGR